MIDTLHNQIMGGKSQDLLAYFDYALKDGEGYPPPAPLEGKLIMNYICKINISS